MTDLLKRSHRGLTLLIVVLIATAVLSPVSALADTNLTIGGTAKIAYANGDDVRLRDAPSKSGSIINTISEGSTVDVVDGPSYASDDSAWYKVTFDGDTGWVISDYLALSDGGSSDAPSGPSSDVVGQGLIAGTSGDGVRCRANADGGGSVITVVPEGTIVDLTGSPVGVWQAISCGGQTGYVHVDYVSYDLTGTDNKGDAGRAADAAASSSSDASTSDSSAAAASTDVVGTATVAGTNGDGVRCRAAASTNGQILTVLEEGSSVSLTGDPVGGWQPVVCAGQGGFVSAQYLSSGGGSSDSSSSDASSGPSAESVASTGTAVVSGTNGDGVRCRSGASLNDSVIVVLSEGTSVSLRSGSSGDWQAVTCAGTNGFVSSQYLSSGGSSSGGSSGGSSGSSSGTGTAFVSGTNGDGVRCRDGAGYDSNVIMVLSEGTKLTLNGDQSGDWQPVICGGSNGYVFAQYVGGSSSGDSSSGGSSGGGSSSGGDSNSSLSSGDKATVSGTNGDGVRLRSGPGTDSSVITVVAEGKTVTVIDGSTGDWVAVSYNGTSGWIHMDYLVAGSNSGGSSSGGSSSGGSSSSGGFSSGDHASVDDNLNLRYSPSLSSGVAAVAPAGTVVEITGGVSSGFYPVNWDGLQGYMSGDYLSPTNADLSTRGGSGDPGTSTGDGGGSSNGGSSGGSASGQAIVDYAMQYLGYPYVWATHGPSSFDCSGFTYWVVLNTLGIDIGAGTGTQIGVGTPVSQSELQPGDLVFFQNTYTWGLSHVGIYIGGGQFIHAENETTGVKISDLSSSYYSSRWYGARRLV